MAAEGLLVKTLKSVAWRILQSRLFNKVRPRLCQTPAFFLEGATRRSSTPFSAAVFASEEYVSYFSKLAYNKEPETKFLGKKRYKDIPSVIAQTQPDLAFVDTCTSFLKFLESENFLVLPYVDFALSISEPMDVLRSRMNTNHRRILRKIDAMAYSYEITNDEKKMKEFYNELYVPYTLSRHGKSAKLVSFAECRRFFQRGGLILVKLDDVCVSGHIFSLYPKDEIYVPILGVREDYLSKGAGYAPLYFLIVWAKKQGYTKIDYGACFPFLTDGVFRYKRTWGMAIRPLKERDPKIHAIRFLNFDEGSKEFLSDNPFIFVENGKLQSLAILDPSAKNVLNEFGVLGVNGIVILSSNLNLIDSHFSRLSTIGTGKDTDYNQKPMESLINLASEAHYTTYFLNTEFDS